MRNPKRLGRNDREEALKDAPEERLGEKPAEPAPER